MSRGKNGIRERHPDILQAFGKARMMIQLPQADCRHRDTCAQHQF